MLFFKYYRSLRLFNFVCLKKYQTFSAVKLFKFNSAFTRFLTQSQTEVQQQHIYNHRLSWNDININGYDVTNAFIRFKYMRLIKSAIKEGGPILEENKKLQSLLQNAVKQNLPSEFIDFARRISVDLRTKVGLFEFQLGKGSHFIIQYEDIDQGITKHHLLDLCESCEATLIQKDVKWPQVFEQKGLLSVNCESNPNLSNIAEAENIASKIGAEYVCEEIDPEGLQYWKFFCDPWALHEVKRHLQEFVKDIDEVYVGFYPKNRVILPEIVKNNACKMIVGLSEIPTVSHIYDNITLTK
ncbi:translational activator of cytochrome c oxidase 1-like [Uloborus diversus]|uniref:translational activator of cytochrome c oxidase 1-like n=1 Tax=Uloborus diversus TaxID=327109 RepID=UPI00240A614F|nr:translational activator of cytochrome c oxidase 1-like [Uloborus diversus]